jgi:ATP-binding cassette subfamily B protein
MLNKLWSHLTKRRQIQFWLLLALMVLASIAEIISLGSLLPFLGVLTDPEGVYQYKIIQPLIQALEITNANQLILPLTIVFISAILLSAITRIALLYVMTRLSFATGADLSVNIYRRTLYQDYSVHLSRNSSELINGIIAKTNTAISGVIAPILTIISSVIMMVGIMTALLMINTKIALIASAGFVTIYLIVVFYTRKKLEENSQCIASQSTLMIKSLQEGLGGIRDVLIDGSQDFYCNLYRKSDLPLRRASGDNQFIGGSPRYIVEAIGMILIVVLAYIFSQKDASVDNIIPVLGVLAFGAQRLLPALQQAYGSYSLIKGSKKSFNDVINLLEQPLPEYMEQPQVLPMTFKRQIVLKNISFRYSKESPLVLKNINLAVDRGSRIGIVGVTGSGKSTLIDIMMGLIQPTRGEMIIDNNTINNHNKRAWQAHIAHVPQDVYLSDGTIEENIAFGIPKEEVCYSKVKSAAKGANLTELIDKLDDGYQTHVGERGAKLSGGQRQRIGIARALYKDSDILFFDEATSALDNQTEKMIMDFVQGLDKKLTIIIIAHRITTLRDCDHIVIMNKDKTISMGGYSDLISSSKGI